MNLLERIEAKRNKKIFLVVISIVNIALTWGILFTRPKLERFYLDIAPEFIPTFTGIIFKFWYWPLVMMLCFFLKAANYKRLFFWLLFAEFICMVLYAAAVIYPIVTYEYMPIFEY